ncbi:MAG TPA: sensor histidine kinase, partial [Spirochaetota bacterium]|nr:sensor histidine kinase [Spirochaetota bacterium]
YDYNYHYNGYKELDILVSHFKKMIDAIKSREKILNDSKNELQKTLNEKVILLQEVHHRVKNNLQIIISLISLQESLIKDEKIITSFKDLRGRIKSMSLIHEKLYQTNDFAHIEFGDYILSIISDTKHIYSNLNIKPKFELNIEKVYISLENSIPLGLIVNEIVTNIYKYAFPQKREIEPTIFVEFNKISDEVTTLRIGDNGVGFPKDYNVENSKSLGFRLITSLSEQINAKYHLSKENGVVWSFEISERVQAKSP